MKKTSELDLYFEKYQGTGNDFIFIDLTILKNQKFLKKTNRSDFCKKLTQAHYGVAADGVIFLTKIKNKNIEWDFFNSDGSSAEMCGNAARCLGAYLVNHGHKKWPVILKTLAGNVQIETEDEDFVVEMPPLNILKEKMEVDGIVGVWMNTGVPHFVIHRKEPLENTEELCQIGARLRPHKVFGKRGTNVTFFYQKSKNEIQSVSYERGVEGLTLACGTGAVAAAKVHAQSVRGLTKIKVKIPGGEVYVDFKNEMPLLKGPAVKIFSGQLSKGSL